MSLQISVHHFMNVRYPLLEADGVGEQTYLNYQILCENKTSFVSFLITHPQLFEDALRIVI